MDQLPDLFAGMYPTQGAVIAILMRANIPATTINFNAAPRNIWTSILREAAFRNSLPTLINQAVVDYPGVDFSALSRRAEEPTLRGPKIEPNDWRGPAVEGSIFEKLIGSQPAFMSINFLETGLARARSVARVVCPDGIGSGFLIRDNLLITNSHVIRSKEDAQQAKIQFNYQETSEGLTAKVGEFTTAPEDGFATSPAIGGDDWTAVRVKGDPNSVWGSIELTEATVTAQDFVSVIQHSGGLPKQVALCSSLVTFADECRVQYLTNTQPGSSGSPVFNNDWRVIALHHSGGWLTEPASKRVFFRNEGIHINAVLRGLADSGLLRTGTKVSHRLDGAWTKPASQFQETESNGSISASSPAELDLWRSLVRIVGVSTVDAERTVEAVVPSWDPGAIVRFRESILPIEIQRQLTPGVRLLADVNLGETDAEKLVFRNFQVAPHPV
ncbi:MAG: serine protease [Isosphaeraceae bacterium]